MRDYWGEFNGEQSTIDDLPAQQIADPLMAQSVLASCLTYAQRDAIRPDYARRNDSDALADALLKRLTDEGWRLTRLVASNREDAA